MADDITLYKGCKKLSQDYGALAISDFGCAMVYGKRIEIGPDNDDIETGFAVTNFNFHVNGSQQPLPAPEFMPGPVVRKGQNV